MSVTLGVNGEVIVMNDIGGVAGPPIVTPLRPDALPSVESIKKAGRVMQKNVSEHTYLFPTLHKEIKPGEKIELEGKYANFEPEGDVTSVNNTVSEPDSNCITPTRIG